MAKPPSHQRKRSPQARQPQAAKKQPIPPKNPMAQWFKRMLGIKSIALALLLWLISYAIVTKNSGYQWTITNYLKGNWEVIRKYRNATTEEVLESKLGFNYRYLNYIKQHTPDTAIILFPYQAQVKDKGGEMQLGGEIASKMWVTHFVYPRRILYKDEAETNPLYPSVTHVAIIAAHGYDDLDYPVYQRTYFDVLPKYNEQTINPK